MKILLLMTALIALSYGAASMIEVSGFKTADQLLNDIQSDYDNIYSVIFFKRDDTNFELTQKNKKLLEGLKSVADAKAPKITDAKIKYLYFARVDVSVPENKRLWERFGLNATSCDEYPSAAVMKNAQGSWIDGPAIVSLFDKWLDTASGLAAAAAPKPAAAAAAPAPAGKL